MITDTKFRAALFGDFFYCTNTQRWSSAVKWLFEQADTFYKRVNNMASKNIHTTSNLLLMPESVRDEFMERLKG